MEFARKIVGRRRFMDDQVRLSADRKTETPMLGSWMSGSGLYRSRFCNWALPHGRASARSPCPLPFAFSQL